MTAADLVSVAVYDTSRVRLKQDFTDDRAALRKVIDDLERATSQAELGGTNVTLDSGGAFGEDAGSLDMFSMDRRLAALQTTVTNLGPAAGAQDAGVFRWRPRRQHRKSRADARDGERGGPRQRDDQSDRYPRPAGQRADGRRHAAVARRRRHVFRRACPGSRPSSAAIPGRVLRAGEGHRRPRHVRQQRSVDGHHAGRACRHGLLHARLLHTEPAERRQVPPRQDLAGGTAERKRRAVLSSGLLRCEGMGEVRRLRQGTPPRGSDAPRGSDHRHPDGDRGQLFPAQQRRILHSGVRADARQRARRARARPGRPGPTST